MKCEECSSAESFYLCIDCDQALCKSCEDSLHKGGKRRSHIRPIICRNCKTQAVMQCLRCVQSLCLSCHSSHSQHPSKHIASPRRIGVFWDLSSCQPTRVEEVQMFVTELHSRIGPADFVKAYGDSWGKWKEILAPMGIACIHKYGIKAFESLLLDLSMALNSGLTHVLVVSAQSQAFTPHLLQLKSNTATVEFWLSSRLFPLQIQENLSEQPKVQAKVQIEALVNYLRDEAFKGNVMIEVMELMQVMQNRLKIEGPDVARLLETADKNKLVFISYKVFEKLSVKYVSLRVEEVSIECLTWTLRSLCLDEMLPSEKAIQSRMREVFDCRPSASEWQDLLQQAKKHLHCASDPPEFSLFSKSSTEAKFTLDEIVDQSSGCKTLLIYPNGEKWQSLDSQSKFCDYLNIKDTPEWKEFLKFLENYFAPKGIRRPKKEEEQKAIPGGRYGCAQLLKVCGPYSLRGCSLGKLSYMVQLAINEDYLRYQRTLLIWTSNNHTAISQAERNRKLQAVKHTILSLLEKSAEGISLAQLPLHLKRNLAFPLIVAELGFAKLKDLLAIIPEVAIELRESNHPFAVFRKSAVHAPVNATTILSCVANLLEENKFGLQEKKLEALVFQKIGKIEWGVYRSSSISQFIYTYGKEQFEIIPMAESNMIFKSKQQSYSYFYEPLRDSSWDSMHDRAISPNMTSHHTSYSLEEQAPGHVAKIVNISNIPYEIMEESEEPNYFFESYNDSSTYILMDFVEFGLMMKIIVSWVRLIIYLS